MLRTPRRAFKVVKAVERGIRKVTGGSKQGASKAAGGKRKR